MLTRFRVNNFRNLINFEFRPVRVNLLIGPNNAGKTNLANAIRFAAATASFPLDEAIGFVLGENWNITNAYVLDKQIEIEWDMVIEASGRELIFEYRLALEVERESTGQQKLRIAKETLLVSGLQSHRLPLIQNDWGTVEVYDEKLKHQVQIFVPRESSALCKLFDPEANKHAILFKQQLIGVWYFNISPQALRSSKVFGKNPVVNLDGSNLNRLLFTLHNENPRLERKIIESLKTVEPKIDLFKFYNPDPDFILFFLEDERGHAFSPQSMSDGTLRYLVLCALFALMEEWERNNAPAHLIIFEEPENGLYVGALKPLMSSMKPTSTGSQCIFTSHSPYFIDLFDANPEGVHIMKPGIPSSSILRPDPDKVRELLEGMPLGELHYREMLG